MQKTRILSSILPICLLLLVITSTDADEKQHEINLTPQIRVSLQKEMNLIQSAMGNLIESISAGDWEATAKTGKKMADSFILKQELDPQQMKELHQSLPKEFIELDTNFHQQAERLSQVALQRDGDLVSYYFSRLASSCKDCHSRYASHRFIGFRSAPQKKPSTHDVHTHGHDEISDANQHMHKNDFDTLVQRFEDPEREKWQNPELIIDSLGDLSNKTIADIGAGTGYFSFRLAELAKKVIAIDVDQRFLDYIDNKNKSLPEQLPVETRLASPDDPKLVIGEVDIVLIVNTYHHIENRTEYFSQLLNKFGLDTTLVIVDFKKEEMPVGPPLKIKLSEITVIDELIQAGYPDFNLDKSSLPYQYIITAH